MGDLYQVVSQKDRDIFRTYSDIGEKMNFHQFLNFARDHDLFPSYCSKAALYRIFHSLSTFN